MKIVAQNGKSKGPHRPNIGGQFHFRHYCADTVDPGLKGQMLNLVIQYRDLDVSGVP